MASIHVNDVRIGSSSRLPYSSRRGRKTFAKIDQIVWRYIEGIPERPLAAGTTRCVLTDASAPRPATAVEAAPGYGAGVRRLPSRAPQLRFTASLFLYSSLTNSKPQLTPFCFSGARARPVTRGDWHTTQGKTALGALIDLPSVSMGSTSALPASSGTSFQFFDRSDGGGWDGILCLILKDITLLPMAKKTRVAAEEARSAPRGRPRTLEMPMRPFSSRLRTDYDDRLTELTRSTGKPKTRLLEEAFELYLEHCERLMRLAATTGKSPRRILADALKRFEDENR